MNAAYCYQDKFPMVDDNSKYNDGYSLLNSKLGFRKAIQHFWFDIYAGINNATGTKYAFYIELNAAPSSAGMLPKFYSPSPRRNFYGGVSLKLNLNK